MVLVYHPRYLFGSKFLNWLHPFRFDRARTALGLLENSLGSELQDCLREPKAKVTLEQLESVHEASYLASLNDSHRVCTVLEVPILSFFPSRWIREWFLTPTLWCVAGSLLAAEGALESGLGFNLGGGFHHAKPGQGEGFCLVSDIAYCLESLRVQGKLDPHDTIFYIDLDVHQGNGVSTFYGEDPNVHILDLYNQAIYPKDDKAAIRAVDVARGVRPGCQDEEYLSILKSGLDNLFERAAQPRLVVYNAGTDVYKEDALGGLALSRQAVNQRDSLVLTAARERGIPMLVLASGGYSDLSAQLVADFVLTAYRLERKS